MEDKGNQIIILNWSNADNNYSYNNKKHKFVT